jgi:hypothetical protein
MWVQYQLMLVEVFQLPQLPSPDLPTDVVTVWLSVVVPCPSLEVMLLSPRLSAVVSDPPPSGEIIQTTVTVTEQATNCTNLGNIWCTEQQLASFSNHIFRPL